MKKNNFKKILEYGIYHDNLEKRISLPGIKNGFPIKSFFKRKSNVKINDFEYITQNILDNTLKKIDNINLLCSGGVDSSLLVCFLNKNKKKIFSY